MTKKKFYVFLHFIKAVLTDHFSINGSCLILTMGEIVKTLHLLTDIEITRLKVTSQIDRLLAPYLNEPMVYALCPTTNPRGHSAQCRLRKCYYV